MRSNKTSANLNRKEVFSIFILLGCLSFLSAEDPALFKLSDFRGALVVQFQKTMEEEFQEDDMMFNIDRNYFEGGVELNFEGSIYHPNLLTFRVDLNLISSRSKNMYFSDENLNNSLNNTYNIVLHLLKRKGTNFRIYTRKNYSTADRRFSERFFVESTNYGFNLMSSNKFIPINLDLYRIMTVSESISYQERDEVSDNLELRGDLSKLTGGRSKFRLKAKDYSEMVFSTDYKSLSFLADYVKFYGVAKRNSILALTSFRKMTGDIDQAVFRFNVNHKHYFKDKLFLQNSYSFIAENNFRDKGHQHLLEFSLNHQLFESLFSVFKFGGRYENRSFRDVEALSYRVDFNYRKKFRSGGINVNYSVFKESGENISKSNIASVSEPVSFSLSDFISLITPGINPESIRLTDNNLSELYIEGIDYQIESFGDEISIFRIPGGAIPAGSIVRISYDYLAFPDYNFIDSNTQLNLNFHFLRYFHIFLRSNSRNQDISSDYTITPFLNHTRKLYGIKIQSGLINGEYSLEDYNSGHTSNTSKNFRLSFGHDISKKLRLGVSITSNKLEYDFQEHYVNFNTYFGNINYRPNHYIFISMMYRNMQYETLDYFRNRKSMIGKLQWNFRKIIIEFFYEYILSEFSESGRSRNYFALRLRRMF